MKMTVEITAMNKAAVLVSISVAVKQVHEGVVIPIDSISLTKMKTFKKQERRFCVCLELYDVSQTV